MTSTLGLVDFPHNTLVTATSPSGHCVTGRWDAKTGNLAFDIGRTTHWIPLYRLTDCDLKAAA